jgi:hypothetical protein
MLEIVDLAGNRIVLLADKDHLPGNYSLEIGGMMLNPGIYLARIKLSENHGGQVKVIKLGRCR